MSENVSKKMKWIVLGLFALGLIIRIAVIPMPDSSDVATWVKWGKITYETSLAKSFQGAYFPIQYLIFTGTYAVAKFTGFETNILIKVLNLIFELGLLGLLWYLTKEHLSAKALLIFYWLNPFSLILSEQGYADAQIAFFILLAMIILWKQIGRFPYLLAGVPLGIALLMKPHATPIFVGIGLLFVILMIYKKTRKLETLKILQIFIIPVILFLAFSLYFGLTIEMKGHNTLPKISSMLHEKIGLPQKLSDVAAKSTFLTGQYLYIPKIMEAINAHMLNPWYFVAESMRSEGMKIYRVKDTYKFIGITLRSWGLLLLLGILSFLTVKIIRGDKKLEEKIILVMLLVPILVPHLTTNAHENHFYYGFVSTILLGALMKDKLVMYCGYLLGTLNGLNVLYLFLLPRYHYFDKFMFETNVPARMALAGAASVIFIALLYHLMFKATIAIKNNSQNLEAKS